MSGGTIEGNSATYNGGAVYIDGTNIGTTGGAFIMEGGMITANKSPETNSDAANTPGDVCANKNSTFTMTGGCFDATVSATSNNSIANVSITGGYFSKDAYKSITGSSFLRESDFKSVTDVEGWPYYVGHTHGEGDDQIRFSKTVPLSGGTLSEGEYFLNTNLTLTSNIIITGTVYLCLNGYVLTGASDGGTVIYIQGDGNAELILCDCQEGEEAAAHNYYVNSDGKYVFCESNCTADHNHSTIYSGVITGGTGSTPSEGTNRGGAVTIGTSSGAATFTMYSGTIAGNTASSGAGVAVAAGTFNMYGGTIEGNYATGDGGGVYVYAGTTFNMEGGTIKDNTATGNGGGVYLARDAKFTMYNGTICCNEASSQGGGVFVGGNTNGYFYMYGGTIGGTDDDGNATGNSANEGGGVYDNSGTFIMYGGTISYNTADYGGGLYVHYSTSYMYGGTISYNTADYGGGVYIGYWHENSGTFTMSNGSITYNTALAGGGIYAYSGIYDTTYVAASVQLLATGENDSIIISGNTATRGNGGGVYTSSYVVNGVVQAATDLDISGNVTITDNYRLYPYGENTIEMPENLYLAAGVVINANELCACDDECESCTCDDECEACTCGDIGYSITASDETGANIGITLAEDYETVSFIAYGVSESNVASVFSSDKGGEVGYFTNSNGESVYTIKYTIYVTVKVIDGSIIEDGATESGVVIRVVEAEVTILHGETVTYSVPDGYHYVSDTIGTIGTLDDGVYIVVYPDYLKAYYGAYAEEYIKVKSEESEEGTTASDITAKVEMTLEIHTLKYEEYDSEYHKVICTVSGCEYFKTDTDSDDGDSETGSGSGGTGTGETDTGSGETEETDPYYITEAHTWSDWSYDETTGVATRYCTKCEAEETCGDYDNDHKYVYVKCSDIDHTDHTVHYGICAVCNAITTCSSDSSDESDDTTHKYGNSYTWDSSKHYQTCSTCGHVISGAHEMSSSTYTDNEDGTHTVKCSTNGCGYTETEAHDWGSWAAENEDSSVYKRTCNDCNATETCNHKDGDDSLYGAWNSTDGTRKCTVCGHIDTCEHKDGNGDSLYGNHTWDSNNHYQTCSTCGHIQAESHTLSEEGKSWSSNEGWTANEDGTHTRECSTDGCGYTETEGHEWGNGWEAESQGSSVYKRTCSDCGASETCGDSENGHGHSYSGWTKGETSTRTCYVCGHEDTCDHSGGTATCVSKAVCGTCGASYGEYAAHAYGEGVPELAATCTQTGLEAHYYCPNCGKYFTKTTDDNGSETYKEVAISDLIIARTEHTLEWTSDESSNSGKHWLYCKNGCGYTVGESAHSYTFESSCTDIDDIDDTAHTVHYGKCVCGAEYTCGTEDNAHSYSGWTKGETSTRTCYVCGHEDTCDHSGDSGYTWVYTTSQHYRYCLTCGYTTGAESHVWTTSDSEGGDSGEGDEGWSNNGDGTHSRTCVDCGYKETADHSYGYTADENGNSCNGSNGVHTGTCVCGATTTCGDTESGSDHSYSGWSKCDCGTENCTNYVRTCYVCGHVDTCSEHSYIYQGCGSSCDGTHTGYCTTCGKTTTCGSSSSDESDGHSYGSYTWDSTYHYRTCSTCSHVEKTGHTINDSTTDWEYGKGWTYNSGEAIHTRTCSTCGYTETELHNYSIEETVGDVTVNKCKCGAEQTACESGYHNWQWVWNNDSHWQYCSNCGEKQNEGKHSNSMGSWVKVDDNTHRRVCLQEGCLYSETEAHDLSGGWIFGENGVSTRTCADKCGYTETCSHSDDEGTSPEDDYYVYTADEGKEGAVSTTHTGTCSVCGATTDVIPHLWTTEDGKIVYTYDSTNHYRTCAICGYVDSAEHEMSNWSNDDNDSTHSRYCLDGCGYTETAAHIGIDVAIRDGKEATCTEDGYYDLTTYCTVCGGVSSLERITISATGHTFKYTAHNNPTCTEEGNEEYWYCEVCEQYFVLDTAAGGLTEVTADEGVTIDESFFKIKALGHTYVMKAEKIASCMEDGVRGHFECSVCGKLFTKGESEDSYTEVTDFSELVISATGHKAGEFVSDGNATCTQDGTKTNYCVYCGIALITIEDVGSAIGHVEGAAVIENEEEASCSSTGSYDKVVYCTVCDKELSRETIDIPKTGHSYEITESVDSTCTTKGYIIYGCENCDFSYRIDLELIAHTVETTTTSTTAATCEEVGSYELVVYCSVCGERLSSTSETVNKLGHTAGKTVMENYTAATCTEDGGYELVVYCSVCGVELSRETVTIPATGHNYDDGICSDCGSESGEVNTPGDETPDVEEDGGDDTLSNIVKLLAILLAAIIIGQLIIVAIFVRKRRDEE